MMVGQTDSKGQYAAGVYDYYSFRNVTRSSGSMCNSFQLENDYLHIAIPVYLLQSRCLTRGKRKFQFRNGETIVDSPDFYPSYEEIVGFVSGGFVAINDPSKWQTVQNVHLESAPPISLSSVRESNMRVEFQVTVGSGNPVRLETPKLLKRDGHHASSFSLPGLEVDSKLSRLRGKSLAINVKSGTSTATVDKQTFSGIIDPELSAIAGYAKIDGVTIYCVFPLSVIDHAAMHSYSEDSHVSQPIDNEENTPTSQELIIVDASSREWRVKNVRSAFTGRTYKAAP